MVNISCYGIIKLIEYLVKKGEIAMKKMVKCQVCGLVFEADHLGESCPKCNAPKEKFTELTVEEAEKSLRSTFTNQLHMKMITLCKEIDDLADLGIEDALDPACVKLFSKAKKEALLITQMARAELAGHMNKGKW